MKTKDGSFFVALLYTLADQGHLGSIFAFNIVPKCDAE